MHINFVPLEKPSLGGTRTCLPGTCCRVTTVIVLQPLSILKSYHFSDFSLVSQLFTLNVVVLKTILYCQDLSVVILPARITLFKANNKDTRTTNDVFWCLYFVNFKYITHLFLVVLMLTLSR